MTIVVEPGTGVALVAKVDGDPIGTCLLVAEIEPNDNASPEIDWAAFSVSRLERVPARRL